MDGSDAIIPGKGKGLSRHGISLRENSDERTPRVGLKLTNQSRIPRLNL